MPSIIHSVSVKPDGGQISAGQPVGGAGRVRQVIEAARQVMGRDGGGGGAARRGPPRGRPGDLSAAAEGGGREPHFGSRLVFAHDGTLFVTQGERFDYRDQAQDLSSGLGKVIRINPDGPEPRDVLQAHHAMLFLHRRLEGRRAVVEVLRLPLQDLLLTPERRAIANISPG